MDEDITERLLARAFLYGDPEAYRSGVVAAIEALTPVGKLLPHAAGPQVEHPARAETERVLAGP